MNKDRPISTIVSAQRKAAIKRRKQLEADNARAYAATKPRTRNMVKRHRRKRGVVHRTVKAHEMNHVHSEAARNANLKIAKSQRNADLRTSYGAELDVLSG